jgi:hypothetical protein
MTAVAPGPSESTVSECNLLTPSKVDSREPIVPFCERRKIC